VAIVREKPNVELSIQQRQTSQLKLLYLALRLSLEETLLWIEHFQDEYSEPPDSPYGLLVEVPFLENVAPAVQVELVASLWHRSS
jgi:hypothetical protein